MKNFLIRFVPNLIIFFYIFTFLSNNQVKAQEIIFREDFDYLSSEIWQVFSKYSNDDLIENGWLKLKSEGDRFPYVCKELEVTEDLDFAIEIRFKYEKVMSWGTGINLGNKILSYPIYERYYQQGYNDGVYTHFQIWQDNNFDKIILKHHPTVNETFSESDIRNLTDTRNTLPHLFKLIKEDDVYSVYLDDYLKYTFSNSQRLPEFICIGNPTLMNTNAFWTEISIDYLQITSLTQKDKNPVIFVPGLMASWNTKAIIFGEEVDPDDWRLIPFAEPVYRRLKESILLNGYEEGIDFYVWPYDWRQPIEVSHQKLKEFIDSLDMPVDQKINLIGHSLGGMVSRSMAQSYPELVDKVITVGSPHQGAVQAYQALAGGKVGEKQDLQWIGLQLLIHLHRRGFQTDAEVVRNIAPVLYNLLPTFQFLEKNNSPFVSSNFTNYYLNELNNSDSTPIFIDKTNFLVGNKPNSTPEKLKLGKRSVIDKALNLWPDGTPIETIYSTGDETVLEISSYLEPAQPYQYPLEHKELIYEDSPLNKILQILGIDNPSLSDLNDGFYLPSAENMVIFYLASPATLEIIDLTTNEKYLPNDPELQFIILGYPNQINNYLVKLSGTGDGEFNFHVGQYTSKGYFWQTYTEEITIGESIEYNFLFDPDLIIPDALVSENGYFHLIQAKKLLEDFNCPQAKKFIHQADQMINKKRWRLATIYLKNSIKQVSHCRKRLNDDNLVTYNISTEAMKQLAYSWEDILFHQNLSSKLLSRIQKKQAEKLLSVANQKFTTLNKYRFKPRILSAMSIKEAENILGFLSADFSNNAYFIIEPESYLAKTFVQEALTYNPTAKIK